MKRAVYYFLLAGFLLLIFLISIELSKNRPRSILSKFLSQGNNPEEARKITLKLSYFGFLPIGKAEVMREEGDFFKGSPVYHLSAIGKTAFISQFYKASVKADSYIDKINFNPFKFTQTLIIPDRPNDVKEAIYDQANNIMYTREEKRKILPNTFDPLSALFYIQHQNLALGKEFDLNINTNQKNYRLYAKVIKKEEYEIGDRRAEVLVLKGEIKRRDKSRRNSQLIQLWLLDNKVKTILLVRVSTNCGVFVASLSGAK